MTFKKLRLKRFNHGISKVEMAKKLGCHLSWVNSLEKDHYSGPYVPEWREKYEAALNELIQENKS